jgi:methylmalonyl-CoA/ethylmalonyl-CoA epimerase
MFKRLHGFNVAVKKENLEGAVAHWAKVLGVEPEWCKTTDFAFPGILGAKFVINGCWICVLAGDNEKVSVAQHVARQGEGVFLVSFEVESIPAEMEVLAGNGVKCVLPKEAPFVLGNVNFIHPKVMNGVQIELITFNK